MKSFIKFLTLPIILITLSGCETVEGIKRDISDMDFNLGSLTTANSVNEDSQAQFLTDGNCPKIEIVEELSRLNEFKPSQLPSTDNTTSSVKMSLANSTCQYNERSVTVDLKLELQSMLGPRAKRASNEKTFLTYPFFVAVTNSNGKILAKEIFAASVSYDAGESEKLYFETLRQIIPADTRTQGSNYNVLIGFQLSNDQLQFNREQLASEKLELERLALEEQERLEAERIAIEDAEKKAKEANEEKPIILKTTDENTPGNAITAPEPKRAGPFDIFKTDDE
ncbi:MAG: hypothetical protein AB8B83_00415 [Bdellovibrionales bacterium]